MPVTLLRERLIEKTLPVIGGIVPANLASAEAKKHDVPKQQPKLREKPYIVASQDACVRSPSEAHKFKLRKTLPMNAERAQPFVDVWHRPS